MIKLLSLIKNKVLSKSSSSRTSATCKCEKSLAFSIWSPREHYFDKGISSAGSLKATNSFIAPDPARDKTKSAYAK